MTLADTARRLLEIKAELETIRRTLGDAGNHYAEATIECARRCVGVAAAHADLETFKTITGQE